jgi:hypothetical protein
MGGEGRMGGFLKVIPTVVEYYVHNERRSAKVTSRWEMTSRSGDGR